MSNVWRFGDDARRDSAAAWVVRLEAGDLGEPEAVAFDVWLSASPENTEAFDAALATSHAYAVAAAPTARALAARRQVPKPVVGRRAVLAVGSMAAGAAGGGVGAPDAAG